MKTRGTTRFNRCTDNAVHAVHSFLGHSVVRGMIPVAGVLPLPLIP